MIDASTTPLANVKLALIGLGPHARRIYYPYIEQQVQDQHLANLSLVVELDESEPIVNEYIDKRTLKPQQIVFISAKENRNPTVIDQKAADALAQQGITHAIIATEPKSHKAYLAYCIEHGIKVLTDKPITAPLDLMPHPDFYDEQHMFDASNQLVSDVEELVSKLGDFPESRVIVQTQRRYHAGYQHVHTLLDKIVKQTGIPITYLSIMHSDGMWNMPSEIESREGHPYKYGYGKLLHSGYHFIDLMHTLLSINQQLVAKQPDKVSVFSQILRPVDHAEIINEADYRQFFGEGDFKMPHGSRADGDDMTFGELDNYSQWQFTKDGKVMTTAQLSLMQSGFSLRAWPHLPQDTYKANGRVRHEMVNIHVGPLYNIQIHSYQSAEVGDNDGKRNGVGSKNHFDIYVFRNAKLLGGEPLEVIHYGDQDDTSHSLYLGQNEQPRYAPIHELLRDLPSRSELSNHLPTNRLMGMLYSNQAKQQFGQIPYTERHYKEIFS